MDYWAVYLKTSPRARYQLQMIHNQSVCEGAKAYFLDKAHGFGQVRAEAIVRDCRGLEYEEIPLALKSNGERIAYERG